MMEVCRVCLVVSVKMYHTLEHKLSVVYERVTGVEINTEDKLPKMLCWECVARLSSAHNFIKKALKTHLILINKLKNSKFITMDDIELLDKTQFKSSLGVKLYKDSYYNVHIVNESGNCYENSEGQCSEHSNDDTTNVEAQMFVIQDIVSGKQYPIKEDYSDGSTEQKSINISNENVVTNFQNTVKTEIIEINVTENASDEEVVVDNESKVSEMLEVNNHVNIESTEVYEAIKQNRKRKKSEAVPHGMELREVIVDGTLNLNKRTRALKCLTENTPSTKNDNEIFSYADKLTLGTSTVKLSNSSISEPVSVQTGSVNDAVSSGKLIICDKITRNETSPKKHSRKQSKCANKTSESNNSVFTCNYCTFETSVKSRLTYHTNTKHRKRSFNCDHCDFVSNVKSRLMRHVNAKHTKSVIFNCSYCNFNSCFKANLAKHINTIHTKTNVFNCPYCIYKTYVKHKLDAHVNAKHTKTNVFKCTYCNYEVYNKNSLVKHINAKHTKTNVFNCSFCDYKTCDKRCLKAHTNAKHTKVVTFTCSYCNYKSFHESNLSDHVNAKHTKALSFDCSSCDYKSYSERLLKRHVNINHTKVKVFICSYCDLQVYCKPTLIRHIKNKHS